MAGQPQWPAHSGAVERWLDVVWGDADFADSSLASCASIQTFALASELAFPIAFEAIIPWTFAHYYLGQHY